MGAPIAPRRRDWRDSRKFWCAFIASVYPSVAAIGQAILTGDVSEALVGMAMAPWMLLGGGEAWHDAIKLRRGE